VRPLAKDKKEANSKSNFKNYFQQNRLALDSKAIW
jgi:hypothetical protein